MPMKPIVQLKVGEKVRSNRELTDAILKNWKYGKECASLGGGMTAKTELSINEVFPAFSGGPWVKLEITGRHPPQYLKISGEELGRNFDYVG